MAKVFKYLLPFVFIICCNFNNYGQEIDTSKKVKKNVSWKRFYVGLDLGPGWLKASPESIQSGHSTFFFVGFCAGYVPMEWLKLGIVFNFTSGALYKEYEKDDSAFYFDNPWEGSAFNNFFGQIQIFPFKRFNFLIDIEGGSIEIFTTPENNLKFQSSGIGYKLGLGYEFRIYKKLILSIVIKYGAGKFNEDYYDPVVDFYAPKPGYGMVEIPFRFLFYF